ncbi:MAG: Trk system potassium transporter TrkA [Oscillospiraceae bacterium]|nr:Trk system potassium transporter TrkA [Oscillospiraceae bacterium]
MKIVILGCGKVGSELVKQLSQEGHDIVVIDNDPKTVEDASNLYDVMTICGSCVSHSAQAEAGVDKADLLIAATGTDELNLLACLTARKLGARSTIARVRDPVYIDQMDFLSDEIGISMYINPEYAAAAEIFRILRFPSAQTVNLFAGGRAEMVDLTVPPGSELAGLALRDLPRSFSVKLLVCAVARDSEVYIPDGSFVLQAGDRISITGEPREVETLFSRCGLLRRETRSVLLVGGSRISYYLAKMLLGMGTRVKIIEQDELRCTELCELLPGAEIVCGDGTDQELLGEEDAGSIDGLVALTGADEENIIVAMYARTLNISKVIAKVNRENLAALGERAGIESVISPKLITARVILRYVRAMQTSPESNVESLYSIAGGKAEALEFSIKVAPGITGIPLREIKTRKNILIACIVRGNRIIIPGGSDCIRPNDHVLVVSTEKGLDDITDVLA